MHLSVALSVGCFARWGMNADTFTSGREFIEHIEMMPSFLPDCVVLDVQMPGMNGLEVQELLVRSDKPLPVIFITAHDEIGVRERALQAGAVAFLRKPFNDELLIKTLDEAIKSSAGESGRGSSSKFPEEKGVQKNETQFDPCVA